MAILKLIEELINIQYEMENNLSFLKLFGKFLFFHSI